MKKSKNIILLGLCGFCFLIGIVCISKASTGYAILAFTVAVIFGLFGANTFLGNRNPDTVYENEVKDLLDDSLYIHYAHHIEITVNNLTSGTRCMNYRTVTNIDSNVTAVCSVVITDYITRLQIFPWYTDT